MFEIMRLCSFQMSRACLLFSLNLLFLNKGIGTASFRIQQPPLNTLLSLRNIVFKKQMYFKTRKRIMTLHELYLYLSSLTSLFLTILCCPEITTAFGFWIPWECEK